MCTLNQPTDNSIYINFQQVLGQKFEIRFTDMHSKKEDFKLFSQPFVLEPESSNEHFQIEFIELQSNEFYGSKLGATDTSVIKFYKKYLNGSKGFTNLIHHAKKIICMSRSTYMCEKLFSFKI